MRLVLVITLATVGCSKPADLKVVALAIDEGKVESRVALKVENLGDEVAHVWAVQVKVLASEVIASKADAGDAVEIDIALHDPSQTTSEGDLAMLAEGRSVPLPPGRTSILPCAMAWRLPADRPPMLGLVSAEFIVSYDEDKEDASVATCFVMQSLPAVLDHVMSTPPDDPQQAATVLRLMEAMPGRPTDAWTALRKHMKAAAP